MKKMQIIWAHPRADSLTAQVVKVVKEEAGAKGFEVSELDLYRMGFSPVLTRPDEPVWSNAEQNYPAEITELFDSLKDKDTLVFVFPVWWYSLPAILKGYIDRVWNYGLAYGENAKLPVSRIRWIALAAEGEDSFRKRGHDGYMEHLLCKSISSYCGVADAEMTFLFDTLGFETPAGEREGHYAALMEKARQTIATLP